MLIGTGRLDFPACERAHRDRWHPKPKSLEIRERTPSYLHGVIPAGRWRNVIEKAAVLVEVQHEHHAVPLRTVFQRVVYTGHKLFGHQHAALGVIIVGGPVAFG